MGSFAKSCGKIAHTIVQAQSGRVSDVNKYMNDVCSRADMSRRSACVQFGTMITKKMSFNDAYNREHFDGGKACGSLWSHFIEEVKRSEAAAAKGKQSKEQKQAEEEAAKEEELKKATLEEEKLLFGHTEEEVAEKAEEEELEEDIEADGAAEAELLKSKEVAEKAEEEELEEDIEADG